MIARPPETLSRPAAVWSEGAGRPGVDVEDRRADLDRLGLRGEVAHERGGVEAVGLGDPDGVEPGLLERGDLVGGVARVAVVHQGEGELHRPRSRVRVSPGGPAAGDRSTVTESLSRWQGCHRRTGRGPRVTTFRIAVIGGTGPQGKGLAYRWARHGHEVVIGSRSRREGGRDRPGGRGPDRRRGRGADGLRRHATPRPPRAPRWSCWRCRTTATTSWSPRSRASWPARPSSPA